MQYHCSKRDDLFQLQLPRLHCNLHITFNCIFNILQLLHCKRLNLSLHWLLSFNKHTAIHTHTYIKTWVTKNVWKNITLEFLNTSLPRRLQFTPMYYLFWNVIYGNMPSRNSSCSKVKTVHEDKRPLKLNTK